MIDLHTHTTNSDGQQTVAELLQKAERQGLKYLSITDHDTVSAYAELKDPKIRNLFSGKIINGKVLFFHGDTHNELLGYDIDIDKISKVFTAEKRFNDESEVIKGMHKAYKSAGFILRDLNEMIKTFQEQGIGRSQILNDLHSDKNLAIAREKFSIKDTQEFRKWRLENVISLHGKYSAPRPKNQTDLQTASRIIRNAGGLVFMAHIFRAGDKAMEMLNYAVKTT